MEAKLSKNSKKVISNSRDEAIRLKNGHIGVEHLFLGIVREPDCSAYKLLSDIGVNMPEMKSRIESAIGRQQANITYSEESEIPMLKQTEKVLRLAFLESTKMKAPEIKTEHLVLAILMEGENVAARLLDRDGVNYNKFFGLLKNSRDDEEGAGKQQGGSYEPHFEMGDDEEDDFPHLAVLVMVK